MGYYSSYGGISATTTIRGKQVNYGTIIWGIGIVFMLGVLVAVAFEKNVPSSLVILSWVGISLTVVGYLIMGLTSGSWNPFKQLV